MSESITEAEETMEGEEQGTLTGKDLIRSETSEEGRYIPYSGGSLGWFENSGVLKCEKGNNYKFYTAIDTARVRQKLFERWGDDVNRRMEARMTVDRETPLTLTWESGEMVAVTKDLSAHGLRVQLTEEPGLQKGEKVMVKVREKPDSGTFILSLSSEVMWVARVGKRRMVWNLGIGFIDIKPEDEIKLKNYLLS